MSLDSLLERAKAGEDFTDEEIAIYAAELIRALKEDEPRDCDMFEGSNGQRNLGMSMWAYMQKNMHNLLKLHRIVEVPLLDFVSQPDGQREMDK